jgi:hypothetical protein
LLVAEVLAPGFRVLGPPGDLLAKPRQSLQEAVRVEIGEARLPECNLEDLPDRRGVKTDVAADAARLSASTM